jgi:hypothetical protein
MMKSIVLAGGLLASLVISGGCDTDRVASPGSTTTASAPDRQPVSGADVTYTTDDGTERPVIDPTALNRLEQKLARDGLYNGSIDGTSSPALAAALEKYRARHDLGPGAVIDKKTADRLGLDWNQVRAGSTASTLDTDVRSAGAKVKSGIERAGDKVEDGVHKTSEKLKEAAHDVKEDLKK